MLTGIGRRILLTLCACFIILATSPSWCAVIRVSTTGDNSNNGSSWALAKKTVGAGITAAVSTDEVWVAAGTYIERITLKVGVRLYGGFAGMETDRTQRNWNANVTVLDGNKGGSVVTSPSGISAATVIDGFTIRNGGGSSGGGVYCTGSSPTISNNTITGNSAGSGGGVYCNSSSPTITNSTITANTSGNGAGIYCNSSSPQITNNTITGNAAYIGGGVYCSSSSPKITNNIVAFNSSGLYKAGGSGAPVLKNNCVYNPGGLNYSGLLAGVGDISTDPKLVAVQYGKVHIQPDSPCVNAGLLSVLMVLKAKESDATNTFQPIAWPDGAPLQI